MYAVPLTERAVTIRNREKLAGNLSPRSFPGSDGGFFGLRSACPQCGLVDKYGINTVYGEGSVESLCPVHGHFSVHVAANPTDLRLNNELWTLAICRYYSDLGRSYVQICGSDYAGFWQEQIVWRNLERPLIILYTPLIVDWSGAKISKSLYLRRDAYKYLRDAGQEYLCSWEVMCKEGKSVEVLCREVELWVAEPYRLFRSYSLHYLHLLFRNTSVASGLAIYQNAS